MSEPQDEAIVNPNHRHPPRESGEGLRRSVVRLRIDVSGRVQGVGFRPFVWNLAARHQLTGWVQNGSAGVTVEVQGLAEPIDRFMDELSRNPPPLALIDSIDRHRVAPQPESRFVIRRSDHDPNGGTCVPADLSVCDDCLDEMRDPRNRRYQYPFINCNDCGPRFTIIQGMPYDRSLTTMQAFAMCESCRREYDDPQDRRFHAQPNACPVCGPSLWFVDAADPSPAVGTAPQGGSGICSALDAFERAMESGKIVAVKGIGGFHLVCDVRNRDAVLRLRERKRRIAKPFAMMAAIAREIEPFAAFGDSELRWLQSRQRPIVLLAKRTDSTHRDMLEAVAPGNGNVGVMLPYSPLHYLLTARWPLLLVTSGNLSEEPIAKNNDEAFRELASVADSFLFHDRDIHIACDDSVIGGGGGGGGTVFFPIRRSRGFAPQPVRLVETGAEILAVGADLKSTFCVTRDRDAFLSGHIGDLSNAKALEKLERDLEAFLRLFQVKPAAIASDLHPDYSSTRLAKRLAIAEGIPLIAVQHHFAHASSLRAEHGMVADQRLLACCFDGTGLGSDGAIWGGEFLLAGERDFQRLAHLQYFPLAGGDQSIRRPYRTALALLWAAGCKWDDALPCVAACRPEEKRLLEKQIVRRIHCPMTSSMGRLFDGVASIIGLRQQVSYEGQAAMELETLASRAIAAAAPAVYAFDWGTGQEIQISWQSLIKAIHTDVLGGVDVEVIAAQFHLALATLVAQLCRELRDQTGVNTVGLTGGVFQNVLLLELARSRLVDQGFDVLTHSVVPPNDAGIAIGQAAVARSRLRRSS